ncbi:hypothetical protein F441_22775 [Phytophthora nicotianae CJ01A1]|uniref:Myb/SANT-like DNA-binding domain-containing protein n=1 Tax=Phytophthora nicotianae CJ01A1 TaxID=1317063 RepID=W2VN66_PHYNI|nr:hypothetical protein F441_22775 [Phytophthora nicotianae CJ01A1]
MERQSAVASLSVDAAGKALTAGGSAASEGPNAAQEPPTTFAWTPKAAEALLRVRYETMRDRFHRNKSAKQLSIAWGLVATETSRLGGLIVDAKQCKSKLKHTHKQYTAYRVAEGATGNATDKPLKEPPCFATMCDVWEDHDGMDADAFFTSDASYQNLSSDSSQQLHERSDAEVECGKEAKHRDEQRASRGWKSRGKRSRGSDDAAAGMMSIGAGLNNIAEAFKAARVQNTESQSSDVLSSLKELTETVRSQARSSEEMMSSVQELTHTVHAQTLA